MSNILDHKPADVQTPAHAASLPLKLIRFLNWLLVIFALLTGILLLLSDIFSFSFPHAPISSAPLLLIGAAYLAFQLLTGPTLLDLGKALIVSSAFIFWGIDQILPPGWLATTLGDVVIVLYVIDLSWLMIDRLKLKYRGNTKENLSS
jgi:hypothetical protein